MGKLKKYSDFINELSIVQPNLTVIGKYTYANDYILVKDELGIVYNVVANVLLKNKSVTAKSAIDKNDWFIKKSINVHGDVYSYNKVKFNKLKDKIIVVCPVHGDFYVSGSHHIYSKSGCPICAKDNVGWSTTAWNRQAERSLKFDGFKLYIIRCYDVNEEFYKIGKTFMKVSERFNSTKLPYEFEVVYIVEGSAKFISDLEIKLHRDNKEFKYKPKLSFNGDTECFTKYKRL